MNSYSYPYIPHEQVRIVYDYDDQIIVRRFCIRLLFSVDL